MPDSTKTGPTPEARFADTHWSVVLLAAQVNAPEAAAALDRLCRTYWYPLYAYVRRNRRPLAQQEGATIPIYRFDYA
jgi:hypothetical protein